MNESDKQAEPAAVDHSGLIKRIDAAIERVTKGWGLMTIPADPRSDVDLVLSECKALLQGENPPFWATDFHPAAAINEQLLEALRPFAKFDLRGDNLGSRNDDQPVYARDKTLLTVGDFKRAVAAIAAAEAAKGGV